MALIDYKEDMKTCHRCSVCKFIPLERVTAYENISICPSISRYNFHAYSGGGKLGLGTAMLEGKIEYTDKLLEVLYNCQLCGGCDVSCKYAMDMEVLDPIYEMRIECVSNGVTLDVLDQKIANLKRNGNLKGNSPDDRMAWIKNTNAQEYLSSDCDVLCIAGCRTSYDKGMWETAKANIRMMSGAGMKVGYLPEETCCGLRTFQMGYKTEAMEQARHMISAIQKTGCKMIVTGCAECYHAYKVLYAKLGLDIGVEVRHTSQIFSQLLENGDLTIKSPVEMTVTYHDPCYLGRQGEEYIPWEGVRKPGHVILFDPPKEFRRGFGGEYDAPRNVLSQIPGLRLVEMPRNKEYAWCCGAGGAVSETNPEFAKWTATERLQEASDTGATAVVTACPGCEGVFNRTNDKNGNDLKIFDLTDILSLATI